MNYIQIIAAGILGVIILGFGFLFYSRTQS